MAYTRSQPYTPGQEKPFRLSRSKVELFMQCPRCFWLDTRMKIKRPSSPPFRINSAIDELLKKEFDAFRKKGEPHPIMVEHEVDAIPFVHDDLDKWRQNFVGVQTIHEPTNLELTGAIDDAWIGPDDKLIVVDYKATAKDREVSIDADWQIAYKRQMEFYQWLLRQNGFEVNDTGYFVYTNGRLDLDGFNNRVEFRTKIIPYQGNDSWIEPALEKIKKTLEGDMPAVGKAAMGGSCDYCEFAKKRAEITIKHLQKNRK